MRRGERFDAERDPRRFGRGSRTRARSSPSIGATCPTRTPRKRTSRRSRQRPRPGAGPCIGPRRCSRCARRYTSTRARRCGSWLSMPRCARRCSPETTPPISTRSEHSTRWSPRGYGERGRVGWSTRRAARITERADSGGRRQWLSGRAGRAGRSVRFRDFCDVGPALRRSGDRLAVVSVVGAGREDSNTWSRGGRLVVLGHLNGLWLGRGR